MPHPWVGLYPKGVDPQPQTSVGITRRRVDGARCRRSGRRRSAVLRRNAHCAEMDEESDALAVGLRDRGVRRGDRVGIYLQNIPQYAISMLALWKVGAAGAAAQPDVSGAGAAAPRGRRRSRGCHLRRHRRGRDGGGVAGHVGRLVRHDLRPRLPDPQRPARVRRGGSEAGCGRRGHVRRGGAPPRRAAATARTRRRRSRSSPTPRARRVPRRAVATRTPMSSRWRAPTRFRRARRRRRRVRGAPLFHITGAVINAVVALVRECALVFANRFPPRGHPRRLRRTRSDVHDRLDHRLHALYRRPARRPSTSPRSRRCIRRGAHPAGHGPQVRGPIRSLHPQRVRDDGDVVGGRRRSPGGPRPRGRRERIARDRHPAAPRRGAHRGRTWRPGADRDAGELELSGTQIISGYLGRPEDTAKTFPGGRLRTGDVAIMDAAGWIISWTDSRTRSTSPVYKVWPREVESALHEHPGVYEAGVTGEPDDYQGERVVAFVALNPGVEVDEAELVAFVGSAWRPTRGRGASTSSTPSPRPSRERSGAPNCGRSRRPEPVIRQSCPSKRLEISVASEVIEGEGSTPVDADRTSGPREVAPRECGRNVLEWYEWSAYAVFAPFIAAWVRQLQSGLRAVVDASRSSRSGS